MEILDNVVENEAISAGDSTAETQNTPELEPSPANNPPESPVLGESADAQPVETNVVKDPAAADAVSGSANPEKQAPFDDGEGHGDPGPVTDEDFPKFQPASESETAAGDTLPEVSDEGKPLLPISDKPAKRSKPVSDAKRAANRANSIHSTGPKTERGKSFSRRNAITHGIFTSKSLLDGEEGARLQELRQELFTDCAPVGVLEEIVVNDIATCYWRCERALRCEQASALAEVAERMPDEELTEPQRQVIKAQLSLPFGENLDRILRYVPTFHRQLMSNIAALERLQKARKTREKEEES